MRIGFGVAGATGLVVVLSASGAMAQPLPQGLTCGLSYWDTIRPTPLPWPIVQVVPEDNLCNGVHSVVFDPASMSNDNPSGYVMKAAPGYKAVLDGDLGAPDGHGYVHQEFVDGVTDPSMGPWFVLPKGAVCGFHHTLNSPGRTCMHYNPGLSFRGVSEGPPPPGQVIPIAFAGCPAGWVPRKAFDKGTANGYWTWCEYLDPNNLSAGNPTVGAVGIACGISDNWTGTDPTWEVVELKSSCLGYVTHTYSYQSACPPGMVPSYWIDQGQLDGTGLGFCLTNSAVLPSPVPPPPPPPPLVCPAGQFDCCGDGAFCRTTQTACSKVCCNC